MKFRKDLHKPILMRICSRMQLFHICHSHSIPGMS